MWQHLINWLEQNQLSCTFQKYFGHSCAGCGIQRAMIELLKGNIYESVMIYPALLPMLGTLLTLFIHLKWELNWSSKLLRGLFFLSVGLILIPYIYKTISNI